MVNNNNKILHDRLKTQAKSAAFDFGSNNALFSRYTIPQLSGYCRTTCVYVGHRVMYLHELSVDCSQSNGRIDVASLVTVSGSRLLT